MSETLNIEESENQDKTGDKSAKEDNALITKEDKEKKIPIIHRTIVLQNRVFEYTGPINQDIIDLLDLIEASSTANYTGILRYLSEYIEKIHNYNEKFKNKLTCFRGYMKMDFGDLFLIFIWSLFYAIACILLREFDKDYVLNRNGIIAPYVLNGSIFLWGFVLSFYSLALSYVPKKRFILILGLIQVIVPAFILLYDFNLIATSNRDVYIDYQTIFITLFLIGSFLYGLLFWVIKYSLRNREHGKVISVIFMSTIHGIIFHGIAIPLISNFFTKKNEDYLSTIINVISLPMIFFIIISWTFIHIKFFYFPLTTIEKNLTKISEGIKKGIYKSQIINKLHESVWWKLLNRKINILASVIIGTIYIYCEINLWIMIKDEAFKGSSANYTLLYIALTLFGLNPFFLIFGISLVVSNFKKSNKFLYAPLFCGSLPMIGLIPLYSYITSYSEIQSLANIILYGFPVSILFWITLILTGIRYKTLFFTSITLLCFFLLLPFAYLYPLNEQNAYRDDQSVQILIYVLGFMGAGFFVLVLLILVGKYLHTKFIKNKDKNEDKTNRFTLAVYAFANLKNCGFWFNSVFFISSFIGLLYSIYNHPSETSAIDSGTLNGVLVVVIFLFILMNIIIRIRKFNLAPSSNSTSLSDRIIDRHENAGNYLKNEQIRRKILFGTIVFCILIIPSICVPLMFIVSDETVSSTFKTIACGCPLTFLIFAALVYQKNRSGRYANFAIPSTVVICWIFIFIPFCVLVPSISAFLQRHSQEFAQFLRLIIAVTAVMLILGVSLFSIIMNVLLKRLEFEKKLRFIVLKLKEELFKIAVKSDTLTCRRLYETFLLVNEEEFYKNQLLDGNPVNWIPIRKDDPDLRYSKQLITMEAYKILKKKGKVTVDEDKKMGCFEKFIRFCCCIKEKKKENIDIEGLENALKLVTFDAEMLIVDDFLNHRFKRNEVELLNEDDQKKNLNIYEFLNEQQENKEKEQLRELEHLANVLEDPDHIKHGKILRESYKTPKTLEFETIQFNPIPTEIQKIKYSEHGSGVKTSLFLCEDWLIHVFDFFSYNESLSNSPPVLTYLNFYQMLRLGGIVSKTRDYDIEYDDDSLITKEQFDYLNDITAYVPLQVGFLAMDLEGFSHSIVELAFLCFPEENIEESFKEIVHEYLYPNLMFHFPKLAKNYKENIRAVIKPQNHENFDLSVNIKEFKQNNKKYGEIRKTLAEKEIKKNENLNIFDIKNRNNKDEMLDNQIKIPGFNNLESLNSPNSLAEKKKSAFKISPDASPRKTLYSSPLGKLALLELKEKNKNEIDKKKKRLEEKKQILENLKQKYNKKEPVGLRQKILFKFTSCCEKLKTCLRKIFKEYPKACIEKMKKKANEIGRKLGFKDEEDVFVAQEEKLKIRKEAPSWPIIVNLIIETILKAEKEYDSQYEKNLILHFNLSNILAIFGKFSDLYTFANYAFRDGIPWFTDTVPNASILEGSGPLYNEFSSLFWVCFGCSISYAMLSIPATRQAKNGTLGMNSVTGQKAGFPHPQFLLTKSISLLGSTLFLMIMRTFIDAFVCEYPDTDYWYMYRAEDVECLSNMHILYMVFSCIGLGLYYPMSTFFFPNFQFQDKALDVKYNPSFIVLLTQAKLIISGLGSLFSSYGGTDFPLILQVSTTSIALLILSITSAKLQPCLIKKFNLWDSGLYFFVSYLNACALFVLLTYNSTVGIIALTVGGTVIITGIFILHRKIYGPFSCFSKKNKVQDEGEENEKEAEKNNESIENSEEEKDQNNDSKESKNESFSAEKDKSKTKKKMKKKRKTEYLGNVIVKDPGIYKF